MRRGSRVAANRPSCPPATDRGARRSPQSPAEHPRRGHVKRGGDRWPSPGTHPRWIVEVGTPLPSRASVPVPRTGKSAKPKNASASTTGSTHFEAPSASAPNRAMSKPRPLFSILSPVPSSARRRSSMSGQACSRSSRSCITYPRGTGGSNGAWATLPLSSTWRSVIVEETVQESGWFRTTATRARERIDRHVSRQVQGVRPTSPNRHVFECRAAGPGTCEELHRILVLGPQHGLRRAAPRPV